MTEFLRTAIVAVALTCAAGTLPAADGPTAPFAGRAVADVIDDFRRAGMPFAYSTGLVDPDMRIVDEPEAVEPFDIVAEILRPHGLSLRTIAGVHLVVREAAAPPDAVRAPPSADAGTRDAIDTIVVSASRYRIAGEAAPSAYRLDSQSVETMPDLGDDPLRIVQRLPGAAASGASARTHFRGGDIDEIGILLNGKRLFDPYHVRDYQSVFSAIDSRAVSGVEVFTGGFPARYGDRMSGLVLLESMTADEPRHTEIGLSVFNTSFLTAHAGDADRWLVSARRGNLDLVIDPAFGEPDYYDVFGTYARDLTDRTALAVNVLYADDQVRVVLETDPEELEQVVSSTQNAQAWLSLTTRWTERLKSSLILSATGYDNLRTGSTNDEEKIVSSVRDDRSVDLVALRHDWEWLPSNGHLVQWGMEVTYGDANYDYAGSASYFGLPALYPEQPESTTRIARAAPEGTSFAMYVSDRWRMTPLTTLEWGLRWDDQTYTDIASDAQLSPRINLLHRIGDETELRFTVGRYHQSQHLHELQIEDGVTEFRRAQRADHLIAGLSRRLGDGLSLRVEAFYKNLSHLRPRFENLFDPLGIIPEFQPDRVRLAPDSGEAKGVEATVRFVDASREWWLTYTLSRTTDRFDGVTQPRSWDQRHAFQGGFTWHNDDWTAGVAASIHSGWPTTRLELVPLPAAPGEEPEYVAVPGPRNAERFATFASIDARISRSFDVRRGSLTAFFEIANLTNRRNPCCRDYDLLDTEDEPALEQGMDFWLPLLPAIGVLWEF